MILIGTTLAAYVMDREETWSSWLTHAEEISASHPDGVIYFAAIEEDARGLEPFEPLIDRLADVNSHYWTFILDDGRTEVTTANRLRHITFGQNVVMDRACSNPDITHLLFLAADLEPPAAVLPLLLELDHPVVGVEIPTYCLSGPVVPRYSFPVQEHMASAAGIMFTRDAFRVLRWRWDIDAGDSDDPCMHKDALARGWPTYVRKDCVGRHHPEMIPAIERRGHDRRVVRM